MPADWTPARSAAGGRNPWVIAVVISVATFMEVLDTSIANVALQHVAGGLAVSYDEATWLLTSYLVANAIVIPASGWLSNVLGRKTYYLLSTLTFTLGSFLCGVAPSLNILLLARVLQGAGGGGLQPVSQAMLIDSFPPAQRASALTLFAFTVILAPAMGPVIGGWITDQFSWRWIFLINVPVGVLAMGLVQFLVDEPPALKAESRALKSQGLKFDGVGFALIGVGLGALEIAADRGQRLDWFSSPLITSCTILATTGLIGFVVWELVKGKDTLLDMSLFRNRNFAFCQVVISVAGVIFYATTQFLPQMLQEVIGYTATEAGLSLTVGGLATVLMMPIVGALSNKVQPRWLIVFGLVVEVGALLTACGLDTDLSFWDASFARVWQAIGLPFLFIPVNSAAYVGLKENQTNQASAFLNVFRNLGGTIGISAAQTLIAQRQQFHQARMVEHLNPLNPNFTAGLDMQTQALAGPLGQAAAGPAALSQLYSALGRQASMLAYIDVFWTMAIFVGLCIPLALLLKPAPAGGSAESAA